MVPAGFEGGYKENEWANISGSFRMHYLVLVDSIKCLHADLHIISSLRTDTVDYPQLVCTSV